MAQATNFAENKSLEKLNSEPLCTAELTGEVKHELIFLLADLSTFSRAMFLVWCLYEQ